MTIEEYEKWLHKKRMETLRQGIYIPEHIMKQMRERIKNEVSKV